jgi:hypothetical protein
MRQGWRVVPNQWKPQKGAVLENLTTIGTENSYPLPSPSLTPIGQTPSNHLSLLTYFLPFCYLIIKMNQFCTLKMEAVHSSEALRHLNFTVYCLVRLQSPKLDYTGLHKSLYKHKNVSDRWLNVLGCFYISNIPVG